MRPRKPLHKGVDGAAWHESCTRALLERFQHGEVKLVGEGSKHHCACCAYGDVALLRSCFIPDDMLAMLTGGRMQNFEQRHCLKHLYKIERTGTAMSNLTPSEDLIMACC